VALARKGDAEKAAHQFGLVLELDPRFAAAQYALGIIRQRQHRLPEALKHWREAARLAPQWPDPLNNVAWALATSPEPELRDGVEAVRLATQAVELASTQQCGHAGHPGSRVWRGWPICRSDCHCAAGGGSGGGAGQAELAERIRQRLALYQSETALSRAKVVTTATLLMPVLNEIEECD